MSEKNAVFSITVLKGIISVYFDTFFVFYFFKVANYEVIPLVKYYLTLYFFIAVGFFLIRNMMKQNVKVPYLRIGISLQALYISLIMLLKDNIINYVILVGLVKGIADGFYHYPKNLLNTEKITNEDRQRFDGITTTINKIVAIIIPLVLGVALTFFSYVQLGKIFFILFVVMFLISFYIDDHSYKNEKSDLKGFFNLVKKDKKIRKSLLIPFFAGFTHSSGVMGLIVTLSKIYNFKTNLNLGTVDSICAIVSLLVCILYSTKIKKEHFKNILYICGIISFIVLTLFAFKPTITILIIYLFVRNSFVSLLSLISGTIGGNLSNSKEIKESYRTEFVFTRDLMYAIARCSGYLILLIVCLVFGKDYIYFILILSGISLLLESVITAKMNDVE